MDVTVDASTQSPANAPKASSTPQARRCCLPPMLDRWIHGPKKEERAGQHLDAAVEDVKALPTKLLRGQLHHASAEGCPNEARPRRVLTGTTAMSGLPLKLQLPNQSNPYGPKPSSNEITSGRSRTAREYEPPRRKGPREGTPFWESAPEFRLCPFLLLCHSMKL